MKLIPDDDDGDVPDGGGVEDEGPFGDRAVWEGVTTTTSIKFHQDFTISFYPQKIQTKNCQYRKWQNSVR